MSTTQPIRNPAKLQDFKDYYLKVCPNRRNYTLCILGLNTALRITDILNLRWKDVYDFREGHFYSHLSITEQKTGKHNTILLNSAVLSVLTVYQKQLPIFPDGQTVLFPSRKGTNQALSRYQAYRIIKNAAVKTGMHQQISCHSLRKTFGYYAWQQGAAPALLMDIYNHSSYQITKRYLGIEQDDKDKIFSEIFL